MKKYLMILSIGLLWILSSCIDPSIDRLEISLNPGVDTIQINDDYQDPGAVAHYGFIDLTPIVENNNLDSSELGTYEITYLVTYKDLEKRLTRYVTVVDEIAPVLSLNIGLDTIILGDSWIDAFVTAFDNSLVTPLIIVSGEVDSNIAGEYIITYTATDDSGNSNSIIRYVNVIDLD
jgi:hypothetical protein